MAFIEGCDWCLVSDRETPEARYYSLALAYITRKTITRTWQRPMTADGAIPESPVNPGGLDTSSRPYYWKCIDRGADRGYGTPYPKMYYETWQIHYGWEIDQDTSES